ncbi:integral membrane sensor hybrid histidine kinase [Calothrix parasitica NIES-267]|uniref:Circadian input-output histidine kinase CikA n=1 Tax=Calothrix parasitica NIES-267 TaxID=1973488 RepID=A0A1Z4M167_9CYAN|nr:integral membrane sensor hybrid histidine kinase [Calothrix parasitica NIES-267]
MKIRNKIIYGYLLGLLIALVGTGAGLFVGNHHQQKALEARQKASKRRQFLSRLQVDILYNRPTKQLTTHLQNPQIFKRECLSFVERIEKIQKKLNIHNKSGTLSTSKDLEVLLKEYEITVTKFANKLRDVINKIDKLLILSPNNKQEAEKLVVNLAKSPEFAKFIEFSDELTKFYTLAEKQENFSETYLLEAEKSRNQIIIISLGISIAIGVIIALYISRTIAHPIQTLNKIALQVTKEDDFTLQAPFKSKDEIGLLASSFNQLIYRVNKLLQEQQIYTEKLEYTKEAADAANKAKSEFLANMSHELRTPLNGILGYAQILQQSEELQKKENHGLQIIYECGSHLLTVINDILDISKIEAGRFELQFTDIHFPYFLERVTEICSLSATKKGINFIYEPDKNLPLGILADEKRLRQVLLNLLNNAIKFTDQGNVTFRVKHLNPEKCSNNNIVFISFQVEDTGIGISDSERAKIFRSFEQGSDKKYQIQGTGLGLAISQKIVELMDSNIQLESKMGLGSTFSFEASFNVSKKFNWEYNKIENNKLTSIINENDEELILPAIEDLQQLLELTQHGSLSKILKTAEEIAQQNSKYMPFSQKIVQLVKLCELEEVEELLKTSLEKIAN